MQFSTLYQQAWAQNDATDDGQLTLSSYSLLARIGWRNLNSQFSFHQAINSLPDLPAPNRLLFELSYEFSR